MYKTKNYLKTIILISFSLFILGFSLSLAQEVKDKKVNETTKIENPNAPQAVEGDVIFSDGINQLLKITDEGTSGAIQFKSGVPELTGFKLYRDGENLFFNGSLLGGGATKIDDLTDAKFDGNNLFIGERAGYNYLNSSPGGSSVGIGYETSQQAEGGSYNVAIGAGANYSNKTGSNNTIIGYEAGAGVNNNSISGSVFLGHQAAFNETTDNKLYIENSDSDTPLIWGDFANDSVKVNGRAHITKSLSVGSGSKAVSTNSLAVGNNTEAHGLTSIAVGEENLAWGFHSSAFGLGIRAMSYVTTAIGRYNVGDGVLGQTNWVGTDPLFEIGNGTDNLNRANALTVLKNGNTSINGSLDVNGKAAIGSTASASGTNSFAIGSNINASGNGTIFLGDNSAASSQNATNDNRFAARFANGYRFYTTSDLSVGAKMDAGDNAWSVTSDSTKKTNFKSVDGEEILNKISQFKLTSWNYKTQDPANFRHYGPMAQEFYSAFGNDGIGTIGNDTTISSSDFDGINFIAIQALEKRSKEQVSSIQNLESRIKELEDKNQELVKLNSEYRTDIEQIKNTLNQVIANRNEIRMTSK